MHTDGIHAPETEAEARDLYEAAGPTAQTVVREVAKAMAFDREEYAERVTSDVVETARDAVFASLLEVHVGDRPEFDAWLEAHSDYTLHEIGSENVSRVAWHAVPFESVVVAATFENEPEAAVGTLRRQAFGRVYRDLFEDGE